MRLIDADALLNRMQKDPLFDLVERYGVSGVIDAEPTVDAVPVIRCKDCKHCLNYCRIIEDRKYDYACALKEEYWYPYGRFRVNENDFCSRAERKEE